MLRGRPSTRTLLGRLRRGVPLVGVILLACAPRAASSGECDAPTPSTGGDSAATPCAGTTAAATATTATTTTTAVDSTPPDDALRPAVAALLGALMDSAVALPTLTRPQLACLAAEPIPTRDVPRDPRLHFLADPDSALLAPLQRPMVLVLHPRRCPPTLAVSASAATASSPLAPTPPAGHRAAPAGPPPHGDDPTLLSVRDLAEERGGAVYAELSVSRGTSGEFWVCAVMLDDLTTARCTHAKRSWTR